MSLSISPASYHHPYTLLFPSCSYSSSPVSSFSSSHPSCPIIFFLFWFASMTPLPYSKSSVILFGYSISFLFSYSALLFSLMLFLLPMFPYCDSSHLPGFLFSLRHSNVW
jgi:hypothetical protein